MPRDRAEPARGHPDPRRPPRRGRGRGRLAPRARLDAWNEHFNPRLWWDTFADLGIDIPFYSHRERPIDEVLPWDHIHIKYGREYLAKEQTRSLTQLEAMAGAV